MGHDAWTLVEFVCLEPQHEFDVLSHASDLKMKIQILRPIFRISNITLLMSNFARP
jgi:hypothetical protein